MSTTVADTQVRSYLDALRTHLEDLPEDDRNELLEDLEEHLIEVAAEDDGTLEQRLGPPEAYAEELRASAGLPSRDQTLVRRPAQRIAERLTRSSLWRSSIQILESAQARSMRGFLKELQPGWWVLRGYLAVVAPAIIVAGGTARENVPFPAINGSHNLGTALAMLGVVVSVWLGMCARERGKGRRLSMVFSLAVAAAAGAALVGWMSGGYSYAYYEEPSSEASFPYLHHADGTAIANICPYSTDGALLPGVLLFDQSGRAIVDTGEGLPDGRPVRQGSPSILNAYPRALLIMDETGQWTPLTCPAAIAAQASPPAPPGVPSPIPGAGR